MFRCAQLFFTSLIVIVSLADSAFAQANTFRRHLPLRWLGQGYSDGYHRCHPGHDTSYYNPYSVHNSFLVSRTPEYQQLEHTRVYGIDPTQSRQFFGGVPFSVYAAPPSNQMSGIMQHSAPSVDRSFEPIDLEGGSSKSTPESEKTDFPPAPNPYEKEQPEGESVIEPAESGTDDDTAFRLPPLTGGR